MSEWKNVCVEQLGRIITGKTPKTSNVEYYGGDIPFLTPSDDMSVKHVIETKRTLSDLGKATVKNLCLPANTICVSCIGSVGNVVITTKETVSNQQINSIVVDESLYDVDFVYYAMSILGRKLHYLSYTSTAVPIINKSTFSKFTISCPPLDTQKKIAAVLSALDDKIELNNAINKNLEEQAQAIYKNMFVNKFKIGSIGDYCKVKSGYAFKSKWWQSKGIRVIKIGSINQDELNLMECSFVSEDKLELASNFVVSAGDLVIAMTGATIGKFTFVPRIDEVLLVNQRVGKFFLGDEPIQRLPFIYCTLKQDSVYSKLINKGQGSAQPNISPQDIMSVPCIMPPNVEIEKFNKVTLPFFETMSENHFGNKKFGELRDTLLPRLMSGEIDVSNVEI